jgi:hypothetical protein
MRVHLDVSSTMDSVIFYQPPQMAVPAFRDKPIRSSTFRYSPVTTFGRQSWAVEQRSERDRTSKVHNATGVVDLIGLDQEEDLISEQQVAGGDPARIQGVCTCYCCRGIGI